MEDTKDNTSSPIVSKSIEENVRDFGLKVPEKKVEAPAPTNNTEASSTETKVPSTTDADLKTELEKVKAELEKYKTAQPTIVEKILTQEEIQARVQAEAQEFERWAVTDKNIKPSSLERFNTVINQPAKDYLLEKYKAEAKKADPDINDAEIEADFDSENGLTTNDEKKLEKALKKLEIVAEKEKQEEFKDFLPLKDQFKTHKEISTKLPVYKDLVEKSKPEVKVSLPAELFGLKEPVEIDVDYSDIYDKINKELKEADIFNSLTAEGVDTEKAINAYYIGRVREEKYNDIIEKLVVTAYKAKEAEIKLGSIAPPDTKSGSQVVNVVKPGWEGLEEKVKEYGKTII